MRRGSVPLARTAHVHDTRIARRRALSECYIFLNVEIGGGGPRSHLAIAFSRRPPPCWQYALKDPNPYLDTTHARTRCLILIMRLL